MARPTPYPDLNTVLHELVDSIQTILTENLLAFYLQGSFAVGDWDEHSDVDFMVVIEHELTDDDLLRLRAMHMRIFDFKPPWSNHLEGSYFPKDILKQEDPQKTPLWYIDNASRVLERSAHDNELVVRWVTREHGIPLYGPPATTFIDPVPAEDLKREVRETMHEWADDIFSGRYTLANQWAQPFAVLSYCRMLHTLDTGQVHSKRAGAQWAIPALDAQWHGLIQRALDNRPDPSEKILQPADPDEVDRALAFIRYALALSAER